MMARILPLLLAATFAWAVPAGAQPAFPDRGTAAVVDEADLLDPAEEQALEQKLVDFEKRNQRQFVVATVNDLQGYDIAEYGYQLGRYWALGDAENDDGIILLIAPNERQMRIEVGYGLEGIIPDGLAFDYIEGMKPFFRNEDYAGGINYGADQIINQLELPPEEAAQIAQQTAQQREGDSGPPIGGLIWFAFIFFFFILPMLRNRGRKRRYRRGPWGDTARDIILWEAGKAIARGIDGNRRGGGWGGGGGFGGGFGGGGGFSGGGGSFGGGGASGGW